MNINNLSKMNKELDDFAGRSIYSALSGKRSFSMISFSRQNLSLEIRNHLFIELKSKIREAKYGLGEYKWGYYEPNENGIPDQDNDNECAAIGFEINKAQAIKLASTDNGYGPQDYILHYDGLDFLGLIISNPELGNIGAVEKIYPLTDTVAHHAVIKEAMHDYYLILHFGIDRLEASKEKIGNNYYILEMGQRRSPKYSNEDWWYNFGRRFI